MREYDERIYFKVFIVANGFDDLLRILYIRIKIMDRVANGALDWTIDGNLDEREE